MAERYRCKDGTDGGSWDTATYAAGGAKLMLLDMGPSLGLVWSDSGAVVGPVEYCVDYDGLQMASRSLT
jgi:hypothetical protein